MDLRPVDPGIDIEDPPEDKPSALEIHVIDQCLSQMSRSYNDQIMLLVQSQDLANLFVEILHIVSISLLSEPAEIIQILSDLGRGHLHDITQFL